MLKQYTLNYVVLRPSAAVAAQRARDREQGPLAQYPPRIYDALAQLGELERHVLDTTGHSQTETLTAIKDGLASGQFLLGE